VDIKTAFVDIDTYLRNLGDDEDIIAIFDDLYQLVRYKT
jgi:hypothetical protein